MEVKRLDTLPDRPCRPLPPPAPAGRCGPPLAFLPSTLYPSLQSIKRSLPVPGVALALTYPYITRTPSCYLKGRKVPSQRKLGCTA